MACHLSDQWENVIILSACIYVHGTYMYIYMYMYYFAYLYCTDFCLSCSCTQTCVSQCSPFIKFGWGHVCPHAPPCFCGLCHTLTASSNWGVHWKWSVCVCVWVCGCGCGFGVCNNDIFCSGQVCAVNFPITLVSLKLNASLFSDLKQNC